jgi:hypothetical protein
LLMQFIAEVSQLIWQDAAVWLNWIGGLGSGLTVCPL